MSVTHDSATPIINQETPACDLDCMPNVDRSMNVDVVLSNAFGFGGHKVTHAPRKYRK